MSDELVRIRDENGNEAMASAQAFSSIYEAAGYKRVDARGVVTQETRIERRGEHVVEVHVPVYRPFVDFDADLYAIGVIEPMFVEEIVTCPYGVREPRGAEKLRYVTKAERPPFGCGFEVVTLSTPVRQKRQRLRWIGPPEPTLRPTCRRIESGTGAEATWAFLSFVLTAAIAAVLTVAAWWWLS